MRIKTMQLRMRILFAGAFEVNLLNPRIHITPKYRPEGCGTKVTSRDGTAQNSPFADGSSTETTA
jgi:hypothetical protein